MGDVETFAAVAHAVALHRFGEDYRRLSFVFYGAVVRRVNLVRIMTATVQTPHIVIRHVGDHFTQLRILTEELLANVRTVARLHHLVLAVDHFFHAFDERAVFVACKQLIPIAAPNELQHVPAGTTEIAFEFLNDLAVTAHRAVEALQVAVDDENEVVELFAAGHADRAERFRLVHFAVAAEHPDFAAFGIRQTTRMQIFQEARLINTHERAKAHRHGGQLPEVRHQPRMRVARNTFTVDFLTEVVHLILRQAIKHEGAGVHARRAVALHVHQVAAVRRGRCVPEVIEADVVERRSRCERRNVTAKFQIFFAAAQHHHRRVPAHITAQAMLYLVIAWALGLKVRRNGV